MRYHASTSILLAAALLTPQVVLAQENTDDTAAELEVAEAETAPAETEGRRLGTVTVTAQKRETSLQSTPVAISAFEGETLEERGIDDLANLQSYIPNLHVGEEQGQFKISLRGIGLQGTSTISDSGVAFYIDGNYIARPIGGTATFHDIERIEVLRGPQGTLYGRNATGGVVNVISKLPTDEFEGSVGASAGSRDFYEVRGVLNVPVSDTVAMRFSGLYNEEEGYIENQSSEPGTQDFFGSNGDTALRGQLLYSGDDGLDVLLSATYNDRDGSGVNMAYLERNIGGPPPTQALLMTLPPDPTDPLVANNDVASYNTTESFSTFARVTKDFGGVEAFLQASYYELEADIQQDFDGSPVDVSTFNKHDDTDAQSIEARLSSDTDSPLSWILGAYYFKEDTYIFRRVRLNGLTPGGVINLPDFLLDENGESQTIAAFGTATYAFTPTFRASLGLRYTEDEKTGTKVTRGNFGQPFPPDIPNAEFPGEAEFSKLTWRAGIEWDATDQMFVYASASSGYKAGGFNATSNGLPYEPEEIIAYEAGIKSDFWDNRARINVDTFYYDYTDLQLTTLRTINNAPGQFTTNAAATTLYGIELDTQFVLSNNWLLNASYSFIDAEFDELWSTDPRDPYPPFNPNDPEGLGRSDLSGNKLPYVSENTLNLGLQYDTDLGSYGRLTAAINHAWRDDMYLREHNDPTIDLVEANGKTDVTVTYFVADTNFRITGYVTNIEDDVQKTNVFVSPGFVGLSATSAYTKPRTFGVRLDYDF